MPIALSSIHRFPVKGLGADTLESCTLVAGGGIPCDRRFAILCPESLAKAGERQWLSKKHFLTLVRFPKLASIQTQFDTDGTTLSVLRDGKQVARGNVRTPVGRAMIEDFFSAYLFKSGGKPKLVEAPKSQPMFDDKDAFVSIINIASVHDLERITGAPVDPVRFRGNLLIDGAKPWQEMTWIGKKIRLGDVELEITEPTGRCKATTVNPQTGKQDMQILHALKEGFGHTRMGVYARVITGGDLHTHDTLKVV